MEANLNQFRLLTVRGEHDANCRRGSCGRHCPLQFTDTGGSTDGSATDNRPTTESSRRGRRRRESRQAARRRRGPTTGDSLVQKTASSRELGDEHDEVARLNHTCQFE